jgi:hypothetical protein
MFSIGVAAPPISAAAFSERTLLDYLTTLAAKTSSAYFRGPLLERLQDLAEPRIMSASGQHLAWTDPRERAVSGRRRRARQRVGRALTHAVALAVRGDRSAARDADTTPRATTAPAEHTR